MTGATAEAGFPSGVAMARALRDLGARTALVKLGALGSVAVTGGGVRRAGTAPVDVVDAAGPAAHPPIVREEPGREELRSRDRAHLVVDRRAGTGRKL